MKTAALNREGVCLVFLSVFLTLLPVISPVEGLFLTTLAPFPLVVLAVKYPWRYVVSVASLEVGGVLLLGGSQALLFSQYGLVSIVMAWTIRQRYTIAQVVLWSVGVPLGVGGVLFVLYGVFTHRTPYFLLTHYLEQGLAILQARVQTMEPVQGVDKQQLAAFAKTFQQLILTIFPAVLVINQLLNSVLNYVLVRYYCRHSRPPIRLDPEDLASWQTSDHCVWVFLASGAALLLPIAPVAAIGLNVFLVILTIYLLQGLAIAVFWGRQLPFSVGIRLLFTLLVLLVAGPLFVVVCTVAGLFDLWIDFRRQRGRPLAS